MIVRALVAALALLGSALPASAELMSGKAAGSIHANPAFRSDNPLDRQIMLQHVEGRAHKTFVGVKRADGSVVAIELKLNNGGAAAGTASAGALEGLKPAEGLAGAAKDAPRSDSKGRLLRAAKAQLGAIGARRKW